MVIPLPTEFSEEPKIILASIVAVVLFMPVSIGIDALPDSASSWNKKGASLFNQGKYSEALQAFDKAIELDPKFPEIWYNKGNALYSQGKYDDAIKAYNKVLELDSQYAYAWLAKGKSLNYSKKYDEAIQCFDKALVIDPQNAEAQSLKDSVLDALRRTTEGDPVKSYDSTVGSSFTHKPNQPPKVTALTPDRKSPQSSGTAVTWIAKANDADKDIMLYRFWLKGPATGDAWVVVQDWSARNQWIWTSSGYDAGNYAVSVYVRDGWHMPETGYDSAIMAAYQLTPNAPPQLTALAPDKKSLQNAGGATKWTASAIDADKDRRLNQAKSFHQQGDLNRALNAFNEYIELNPQDGDAWNCKGEVLRDQGKIHDAILCFEKSKELNPSNYAPWYNEVMALIDTKSYIDKKLVRIDFDNSPTYTITYEPQSVTYVYDTSLEIAAKLNPQLKNTSQYWYYVGASYTMDGDQTMGDISSQFFKKAIDAFNKALGLDSNFEKASQGKNYAQEQLALFGSSTINIGPGGAEWISY